MPPQLAAFIAIGFVLGLAVQLSTGEIRLYMAPESWREVSKAKEPGRFWAFIVAEIVVLGAVLTQAVLGSR